MKNLYSTLAEHLNGAYFFGTLTVCVPVVMYLKTLN